MYNLLMTSQGGAWQRPTWGIPASRMFEYTHEGIRQRLQPMNDEVIAELMSYPALFAYERFNREPARVGRITNIQRRHGEIGVTWSPDPQVAAIEYEMYESLLPRLDIDAKYEVNRTHWAVKDVNLGEILQSVGLAKSASLPMQPAPPKVFVSYKWGSPERNLWVAAFAAELRRNGVDVILDQWHLRFGQDMSGFMVASIRDCDRVIILYTEDYVESVKSSIGGVAYEHMLVTAQILREVGTIKFIPAVRQDVSPPILPMEMNGRWYVNLADGPDYQGQIELLLRELHGVPRAVPPIGPRPYGFL